MPTRMFSTLAPKVNASAPGCPYPLVVEAIRDAAIRVCERTLAWRYEQPPLTLTPGRAEYKFASPVDTVVQAVFSASLNDSPLVAQSLDAATERYPRWPVTTTDPDEIAGQGSEPRAITQVGTGSFVVLPAPDAERPYELRLVYALKPSRDATGMDEVVFNEYEDAVYHNALQHLLVMPGVEWSDRELATYHARQYLLAVTSARAQANLTPFRATLHARAPRFA